VQPPSLALFFVGAVLVGIGSGTIYRGSLTLVVTTSSSSNRAGALASFFVVGYVGISIPVVGAGIALQSVSFQVTVLVLAAAVALGSVLAARVLLRLPTTPASGADRDAPRD
jgi:MFS family permease